MSALGDVLRHLNDRVPGTQEEHDQIADLIDQAEAPARKKETSREDHH